MVLWDHLVVKCQHNWFLRCLRDRITHWLLANLMLSTETTEQFNTYLNKYGAYLEQIQSYDRNHTRRRVFG
jgi:hypothetical protein